MQSTTEQPTTAALWIGPKLRQLRLLAELRADEVAHRAGLSAGQLNHIERGRRPVHPDRAARILAALDVAPRQDTPSGREAPVA